MKTLDQAQNLFNSLSSIIPPHLDKDLIEIDATLNSPNAWNNPKITVPLLKKRAQIESTISSVSSLSSQLTFFQELYSLSLQDESSDKQVETLLESIKTFYMSLLLSDPVDDAPAILSINVGQGGFEAANWVSMLTRMYFKFAEKHNFQIETLHRKDSEEHSSVCIDSISLRIIGKNAYGLLKSESGVHRLIRHSPFNANDAIHTSFAAVSVSPDIEDTISIDILDKDIEITAQRGSGAGGQNQNKVSSAIRIKHLPTGINVLARTERDQLANKRNAIKILKSKLYQLELDKKNQQK
jgi:peptide chain release factor 2